MPRGYEILFDLETLRDYSKALARKVSAASVDCPDAIARNLPFIRKTLAQIQDDLAIVDEKTTPKEVRDAA